MDDESSWEASEIRSDLSGRSADALDIAECRVSRAQLTLVTLDRCRIRDSLFADCEASGASLEAVSLARVEFRRCRLNRAILSRGHLRDVRFVLLFPPERHAAGSPER